MNTKNEGLKFALALSLIAGLSGCAMFNRGNIEYTRSTTLGQELLDLQEARGQNAISEEEYDAAKKAILETPFDVKVSSETEK